MSRKHNEKRKVGYDICIHYHSHNGLMGPKDREREKLKGLFKKI
jgi:hypothetical protein